MVVARAGDLTAGLTGSAGHAACAHLGATRCRLPWRRALLAVRSSHGTPTYSPCSRDRFLATAAAGMTCAAALGCSLGVALGPWRRRPWRRRRGDDVALAAGRRLGAPTRLHQAGRPPGEGQRRSPRDCAGGMPEGSGGPQGGRQAPAAGGTVEARERFFEAQSRIPVEVSPEDPSVAPLASFDDPQLHPVLRRALRTKGFRQPTPSQKWALPYAVAGKDLMVCSQTGSGKTLAYLLPALQVLLEARSGGRTGRGGEQEPSPSHPLAVFRAAAHYGRT